jgi:hypothetical protein
MGRKWYDMVQGGQGADAAIEMIIAFSQGTFPEVLKSSSLGVRRAPKAPASNEYIVWRCVSPKSGRVGKLRPAQGE